MKEREEWGRRRGEKGGEDEGGQCLSSLLERGQKRQETPMNDGNNTEAKIHSKCFNSFVISSWRGHGDRAKQ